ncbi:MAG TPA: protein-L-isoaspartate(D-aspartate) O-methyltransferase [Lacipirellulaceae bacterium]|nr:protein-L-isoaspartate(D-aspartate) O-methyltransferase [Lacipirellulaceae bacterium]
MNFHRASAKILLAFVVGVVIRPCTAPGQSLRDWKQLAGEMVDKEIEAAGVTNARVIRAMRDTPRHEFVPANQRQYAYYDMALPIGSGQTISPPFIVASMTEAIDPQPGDRVLEIGTGSGYQAAVLSPLVRDVYTIEIVEPLSRRATRALKRLKYDNVHTRAGDGYLGWPEAAPFDKIIVTCSPEKVPQPLVDQLRDGGLMIIPVGERYQQTLYLMRKANGELESEALRPTLFVPMTGEAESKREVKPDPLNPQIVNGSFEEVTRDEKGNREPAAWHYQRQLTLESDTRSAPDGKNFVTFENAEPGRGCQALQGFAIDGRKIDALELSVHARGENVERGQTPNQLPAIVITFYDERRAAVGEASIGPFSGTFDWRKESDTVRVPLRAREAILRIGLLGATGRLSLDDLTLNVAE